MMNETKEFLMPQLLEIGPGRMIERAKASGPSAPLVHYKIHIYGASATGLTPQSWIAVKRFWETCFEVAVEEWVADSPECDVQQSDH
jgi:hypothetical protein